MCDTNKQTEAYPHPQQAIEACMDACGECAVVMTSLYGKPALAVVSVSEDGPGYFITPLPGGARAE